MQSVWASRIILAVTLIIAQVIFVAHDDQHHDPDDVKCQICLHASAGGNGIPAQQILPTAPDSAFSVIVDLSRYRLISRRIPAYNPRSPPVTIV